MSRSIPFVVSPKTAPSPPEEPSLESDLDRHVSGNTPYISSIDVEDEILTIVNPAEAPVNLSHYYVKDEKELHRLDFPENTQLDPHGILFVYTCPGRTLGEFEEPNVLWRNNDGSLRKKEILNNFYCKMTLFTPDGVALGSCLGGKSVEPTTPYLSAMDVERELLVVANPLPDDVDLSGFFVQDIKASHRLHFPAGCVLPGSGHLYVYTCPGADREEEVQFREPYVLWRNQDGSLRKKEVLHNNQCTMLLFSPEGKCLASCSGGVNVRSVIGRRQEIVTRTTPSHNAPAEQQRTHTGVRERAPSLLRLRYAQGRLWALALMVLCALLGSKYLAMFYWMSLVLDLASYDAELPPAVDAERVLQLNLLGDKINVLTLYTLLCLETLQLNIFERESVLTGLATLTHQQFALLLCIFLTALEAAVLSRSDSDERSVVYNFLDRVNPNIVPSLCIVSEVFMLMAFQSSIGVFASDGWVSFLTQITLNIGVVAFLVRQANNLCLVFGGVVPKERDSEEDNY